LHRYKTAEKVSERLNEMGQNLTGMIDEINVTSSSIQKTSKPDDPVRETAIFVATSLTIPIPALENCTNS